MQRFFDGFHTLCFGMRPGLSFFGCLILQAFARPRPCPSDILSLKSTPRPLGITADLHVPGSRTHQPGILDSYNFSAALLAA